MPLNCGIREDAWESLGLQGDQTSQSERKPTLNIHWKDWHWSWSSNTLVTWCEELTHWKDSDAGKDWRQKQKRVAEDEMVDGVTKSMDVSLNKLWETVKDRKGWCAVVHGVTKSRTWLSDWTPTGLSNVPPWFESILGLKVEAVHGKHVSLEWTETSGASLPLHGRS